METNDNTPAADLPETAEPAKASANLPAVEAERIAAIEKSINISDPSLTVTYGAQTMQEISRFADDLLGRVKAKDSGQVGETLTDLMVRVKGIDVSEVAGEKRGILERLPVIGSFFDSMERTIAKFNTLSEQVSVITDKLEEAMVGLLRDVNVLQQLYEHNENFHRDLSAYIEAGKRKLEDVRANELPRLKEAADASGDPMEAQKVRDLAEQLNRFERRLHDLQLSRTITVQTAPQIRLIQSNNQTLAEKIQTSILTTIPIWKSQMVLALSLQGQKNAALLQKSVADTTNDMLRKNADLLEQSSIRTAREVERSVVDIDTLREVHAKLVSTIEESMSIAREGREKRLAAEKELGKMELQLKEKLTSLAAKKTHDTIGAATGTHALPGGAAPDKPEGRA
ncbi:MAG: toxic anion resistance protein [Deltaproteobacteria bacterium]|nr:toxic anion resistance protein [Deltaproteobacteria bacterium]